MKVDGGGGVAPHTHLNLVRLGGNSIIPGSVYSWDREPQCPVNRLDVFQSRYRHFWGTEKYE